MQTFAFWKRKKSFKLHSGPGKSHKKTFQDTSIDQNLWYSNNKNSAFPILLSWVPDLVTHMCYSPGKEQKLWYHHEQKAARLTSNRHHLRTGGRFYQSGLQVVINNSSNSTSKHLKMLESTFQEVSMCISVQIINFVRMHSTLKNSIKCLFLYDCTEGFSSSFSISVAIPKIQNFPHAVQYIKAHFCLAL